jgi:threonine dehydrogenase-like Zn-dependent dehydrogenase
MKAWRFYDTHDYRLEEIPIPQVKEGWVLLKIKVFQLSVSEISRIKGMPTMGYKKIRDEILKNAPALRFGHEFTGEVVEPGKGVTPLKVGDRVVSKNKIPCHQCALCRSGREEDCRKGVQIGFDVPGCLSEFALLPGEALVKLSSDVDDHEGATLQPLSSCVQAVVDVQIKMGDTVAVLGQGVMGLSCMQLAKIAGAGKVIALDVREENLAMSRQLGADEVLNGKDPDLMKKVSELTSGLGPDIVFECAGGTTKHGLSGSVTLNQAMEMVRDTGKILQIATFGDPVELNLDAFRKKAIQYLFPRGPSDKMWAYTVQVVGKKKVKVKPTIGKILHGLESFKEAVELTAEKGKFNLINPPQVVV